MNRFGVSAGKRLLSRLLFYPGVVLVMWCAGDLLPTSLDQDAAADRRLGVAPAYFGVPIAEIPVSLSPGN